MGLVSTPTLLSIDQWAVIMGLDRWEFNQIGEGFPAPNTAQCQTVWFRWQWQRDFIAREEIGQAIADAELMVANELGYWPAPHYEVDEIIQYPRPHQNWLYGYGKTIRGDWKTVNTRWHRVIGGGLFNRTVIDDTVNTPALVSYSDVDGDGVDDTFTVTVTTTVTEPDEIAVYVQASDRLGEAVGETWRIRPISVTIAGGVATITGHSSLMVLPELTTVTNPVKLDVTNNAIYISAVEVYRVFRDDTATSALPYQGVAQWDEIPDCDADCEFEIKELCIAPRNNHMGQIAVNWGTPASWPQNRQPDRLSLNYWSGIPLVNGQMEREMALIVARLATSLLPSDKCGCERSQRILHYWRAYPSAGEGENNRRPMTIQEITDCPFEPRMGALYAWKRIKYLRDFEAIRV